MAATADIPIIDISGDQDVVAKQLVDAAQEHGFIYIRNLGADISANSIDGAFALSRKLFDAPLAEKQACTIQTNNRGWSGMHSETLDPKHQKIGDFKEAFNFGEFIDGKAQQPLPPTIADDEPQVSAFADSCHKLCRKLLHLLGIGLEVGDFFSSAHITNGESSSILRFLRYPPPDQTSSSSDDVRAGAHSDYGSITLLFRLKGQAGLELQKKDGSWAPVPVEGETSAGPRYSIAFFCHPAGSVALEPVPSERVKNFNPDESAPNENPYAERKVMTANEHLFMRLKESYGTLYDDEKKP
ncbi:hypothetical protein TrVFT333_000408 [Trichoderma virens FT-333]|nr:hypothetical protein TrVFT333_000408 [Trichoderma virens FT-333]